MPQGFTLILVVIDRLSKCTHFVALKSNYSNSKDAETFLHHLVKSYNFLKSIVSDQDLDFTGHFWQQLFKLSGASLAMSTENHP